MKIMGLIFISTDKLCCERKTHWEHFFEKYKSKFPATLSLLLISFDLDLRHRIKAHGQIGINQCWIRFKVLTTVPNNFSSISNFP